MYIGDFKVAAVIDLKFTTRSFSTGAPTTLAGTPAISIYKDNDTTQTTTGITLTVDFDGVTGLNNIHIDTSNAFYAAGSNFQCVITTGTVGGVSVVGETVGAFSIEATSSLRPTVAGRTLDVSATGEAGVDWANVGGPTTSNVLSNTTISAVTNAVGSVTGNVGGNLLGSVSGSIAGSVASVSGNVGGNVVGSVGSVTGAVGSVTGNVGGSVASVTALAANSVNASALAADAATEIATAIFARAFSAAYGSFTFDEMVKIIVSALAGKSSGFPGSPVFRNLGDTGNVISATASAGNRTAVAITP